MIALILAVVLGIAAIIGGTAAVTAIILAPLALLGAVGQLVETRLAAWRKTRDRRRR